MSFMLPRFRDRDEEQKVKWGLLPGCLRWHHLLPCLWHYLHADFHYHSVGDLPWMNSGQSASVCSWSV